MSQKVVNALKRICPEGTKITSSEDIIKAHVQKLGTFQIIALANLLKSAASNMELKRSGTGITILASSKGMTSS